MGEKTRSQKKREQRASEKAASRAKVYIPIPDEFLDVVGEPWSLARSEGLEELDLREVLIHTIRRAPVKTGGDAERTLDVLNAFKGRADWARVCASKMGALGLARALAVELAPHRILVNHIVPGAFDTTPSRAQGDLPPASQRVAGIPLGRVGIPEEIAKTCAFLASDEASYITGQTLHVNGGALAY